MSEWWTYHLSNFLLFSARTYYRLFEIYNAAIWPAQIPAIAAGVAIPALLRGGTAASRALGRAISVILAACWLFVAVAFHAKRYASINTFGIPIAWAFGIEAALLIGIGVVAGRLNFAWPAGLAGRVGLAIFLFALVVQPLVGLLLGRSWRQIELFGVSPDPTAVATLGVLLTARVRRRWLLMTIPVVWCAVAGLTLLAMKAPDFWVTPLAAVVAASSSFVKTRPATEPAP